MDMKKKINYQSLFEMVSKKFPEVNARFVSFEKNSVMRCNVFSKNIYYNPNLINKIDFSKKAIIGIIAHEFSHKIDYRLGIKAIYILLTNWFLYKPYSKYKRWLERGADIITVERGFGKELLIAMKETRRGFDKERYAKYKHAHLSLNEVRNLIKKINSK